MFNDRTDAGQRLAERLAAYKGTHAVVLALPRGGVVVGERVARALGAPFDIIAVRKIGAPGDPEYAIGAVDGYGTTLFNEVEKRTVDKKWLAQEIKWERAEARRRGSVYRDGRLPLPLAGKTVIIVDDGIATGLTMRLAVRSVKAEQPAKVVVAVPVAPAGAVRALRRVGAEVVVLEPPEDFAGSVGAHYARFPQVSDQEVIELLRPAHAESHT
jgi:putative phosphoribosyl transferase